MSYAFQSHSDFFTSVVSSFFATDAFKPHAFSDVFKPYTVFFTTFTAIYGMGLLLVLCTQKTCNRVTHDSINEFVGKTDVYCSEGEEEKVTNPLKPSFTRVNTILVQEEINSMKETHVFGIERWPSGPFLEFDDIMIENAKLYCIRKKKKMSVAKCIEETKRTTRPRWIHHLCFLENEHKPVLLKTHLEKKHNITFS